jgi:hypothetical protein
MFKQHLFLLNLKGQYYENSGSRDMTLPVLIYLAYEYIWSSFGFECTFGGRDKDLHLTASQEKISSQSPSKMEPAISLVETHPGRSISSI